MNNKTKESRRTDFEFTAISILRALLKKLWLIILVAAVLGTLTYVGTRIFVKPSFRCSFTAYINNQQLKSSKEMLSVADLTASKELVRTYSRILTSKKLLVESADALGMDNNYTKLKNMVSTGESDQTEIITVYVTSGDPRTSYRLATAISEHAPKFISDIVEGSSMKIIDEPEYTTHRHSPSYLLFAFIGAVVGALIIILKVIIGYFRDDAVKTEEEVEVRFTIPLLGIIPDINSSNTEHGTKYYGYGYEDYGDKESVEKNENEN